MWGGYYNYITNSNPRAAHEGESTKHKPKKPPHMKCRGGVKKENKRKRKKNPTPHKVQGGGCHPGALVPARCSGASLPIHKKMDLPHILCKGVLQIFTYKTNPLCMSNTRVGWQLWINKIKIKPLPSQNAGINLMNKSRMAGMLIISMVWIDIDLAYRY